MDYLFDPSQKLLFHKMVNLGPIYFQLDLPIISMLMKGKTNFKKPYFKKCGQGDQLSAKIDQDATFAQSLNGHNFSLLLTFHHTKITSSARRIEKW